MSRTPAVDRLCRVQDASSGLTRLCRVHVQKLKDIAKLKADQAAGKEMNQEQLDKMSREAELTRELQELTV